MAPREGRRPARRFSDRRSERLPGGPVHHGLSPGRRGRQHRARRADLSGRPGRVPVVHTELRGDSARRERHGHGGPRPPAPRHRGRGAEAPEVHLRRPERPQSCGRGPLRRAAEAPARRRVGVRPSHSGRRSVPARAPRRKPSSADAPVDGPRGEGSPARQLLEGVRAPGFGSATRPVRRRWSGSSSSSSSRRTSTRACSSRRSSTST